MALRTRQVKFYRAKDVPEDIIETIKSDALEEDYFSEFYHEQLLYINSSEEYDNYFVAAFVDDMYVGGVMLFMDTQKTKPWIDAPSPAFQAIAKTRSAMKRRDFSLNHILITGIKEFLKTKDINKVYVDPVGPQRELLMKYGFEEVDIPPHEYILRAFI